MIDELLAWYKNNARDIVWRRGTTPWGVLLSEVMSQQTQVSRVEPQWEAWMERWPTPKDFAKASPDEILRAWGSLGYPRRALRLLDCARAIVEKHGGEVPNTVTDLLALPGVGAYTARAIAAFAYRRRVPVVDTNVRRVLRRYKQAEFHQGNPRAADLAAVEALLPEENAPDVSVALMELGALVCIPEPKCEQCPIQQTCAWQLAGCPKPAEPPKRRTQKFAGTDRQVRGIIMAHLRNHPEASRASIDVLWPDSIQLDRSLFSLLKDGLAEEHTPGKFRLPVV
ncbi:A/G-specific adenine glycosylase [Corynebacterium freiburgense]|uniref:A/G-specific adenine glycosylase n=1 Tax=Corynebacterium freiburgense TaxID=556548 RepID=UPI0003FDC8E8|nr:A/G-specific adenine glycosylase [Corynebacterium freiburgense]WJZ03660.1 A/G-specific adenine glycosylase [Corynebacterium freiburgense]